MQQTKQTLSEPRRRLVEAMQEMNYGEIHDLAVRGGDPVFDPPPRTTHVIKIGGDNSPRPELEMRDFALRRELIEFFTHIERLGNGVVQEIEVQRGLPFKVRIEGVIA